MGGHVPHGFYEKEMRAFFSQFGVVTRLRLSRSKRTGRSKGYAFLEFRHEEVAKVAADKTKRRQARNAKTRNDRMNQKTEALKALGIDYECQVESEIEGNRDADVDAEPSVATTMETT